MQSDAAVGVAGGATGVVLAGYQAVATGGIGGDGVGVCQGGSEGWVQVGDGVVVGGSLNRWYTGVEVGGKVARLGTAGMRLSRNERIKIRLVWVSGDGRDAEYEVVERYEQPDEGLAKPVGFEGQVMPKPDREEIEPVGDSDLVVAGGGAESGSESVVLPVESETENAEDYLEKARRQAYAWAAGQQG